jgi:thiamine biosynthesis lipoprotein
MDRVVLDPEQQTVAFSVPGVELNLAAVGKGWALDRIAAGLRNTGVGRALVSAGGSSFRGWGRGEWPLSLSPGRTKLADLWVEDASLGTSGAGEQHLEVGARRLGHVIDPRTGRPAEGVRSASVVAEEAASADALATAFLIGGPPLAREYCAAHPGTLALLVLEDDPDTLLAIGSSDRVQVEPVARIDLVPDGG